MNIIYTIVKTSSQNYKYSRCFQGRRGWGEIVSNDDITKNIVLVLFRSYWAYISSVEFSHSQSISMYYKKKKKVIK